MSFTGCVMTLFGTGGGCELLSLKAQTGITVGFITGAAPASCQATYTAPISISTLSSDVPLQPTVVPGQGTTSTTTVSPAGNMKWAAMQPTTNAISPPSLSKVSTISSMIAAQPIPVADNVANNNNSTNATGAFQMQRSNSQIMQPIMSLPILLGAAVAVLVLFGVVLALLFRRRHRMNATLVLPVPRGSAPRPPLPYEIWSTSARRRNDKDDNVFKSLSAPVRKSRLAL
ncbi:hypothetical protein BC830DRAFT_447202 [Chytriomyces sp. MP71]|nr:hypothetical protein BC830DRAFT_447202 [Chytriomyces sp. MP71]